MFGELGHDFLRAVVACGVPADIIGRDAAAVALAAVVLAAVVRHGHGEAAAVAWAAAVGLAPVLDHLRVEPGARHLRRGFLGVHADIIGRDAPRLEGGASRAWMPVRALVDKDIIAVLPALRPDAIETYADPSGAIKIVSGDELRLVAPPEHGDSEARPVLLLVAPPAKLLRSRWSMARTTRGCISRFWSIF